MPTPAQTRPRVLNKLSALGVTKLKIAGTYEDGGGLRLVVSPTLSKRWVMRVTINGRRRERGLGGFPTVTLEEARRMAAEIRAGGRKGRDTAREGKRQQRSAGTSFSDAFASFFEVRRRTLSNSKHASQWVSTMQTYAFPLIGDRPVSEIEASEVLAVLAPIWFDKPETARRVLQRMEAVFKSAILRGTRMLASPCIGVADELGTRHRQASHFASLPWIEVPEFVNQLRARKALAVTRWGLEFLILTAARSGEVRGAVWREFDISAKEWRIPAERMKTRRPHTVALSTRALELIELAQEINSSRDLVFAGPSGRPLSDMTFTKLLRDMGYRERATAHGFRSSFKVWAAEVAQVRDEVSEAALAHTIPQKVRAAYLRTDFLEERSGLMSAWSDYVCGVTAGEP